MGGCLHQDGTDRPERRTLEAPHDRRDERPEHDPMEHDPPLGGLRDVRRDRVRELDAPHG